MVNEAAAGKQLFGSNVDNSIVSQWRAVIVNFCHPFVVSKELYNVFDDISIFVGVYCMRYMYDYSVC